jgi:hypothetical protein
MSYGSSGSHYSLAKVLKIIAQLREELKDDPDVSTTQRAQLEALLSFYLALSKNLEIQVDSIMSSE